MGVFQQIVLRGLLYPWLTIKFYSYNLMELCNFNTLRKHSQRIRSSQDFTSINFCTELSFFLWLLFQNCNLMLLKVKNGLRFSQFSTRIYLNRSLIFFVYLHNAFHWHIWKSRDAWKMCFIEWTGNESCSFQQVLRQNLSCFLSKHRKTLFLRDFILKSTERA